MASPPAGRSEAILCLEPVARRLFHGLASWHSAASLRLLSAKLDRAFGHRLHLSACVNSWDSETLALLCEEEQLRKLTLGPHPRSRHAHRNLVLPAEADGLAVWPWPRLRSLNVRRVAFPPKPRFKGSLDQLRQLATEEALGHCRLSDLVPSRLRRLAVTTPSNYDFVLRQMSESPALRRLRLHHRAASNLLTQQHFPDPDKAFPRLTSFTLDFWDNEEDLQMKDVFACVPRISHLRLWDVFPASVQYLKTVPSGVTRLEVSFRLGPWQAVNASIGRVMAPLLGSLASLAHLGLKFGPKTTFIFGGGVLGPRPQLLSRWEGLASLKLKSFALEAVFALSDPQDPFTLHLCPDQLRSLQLTLHFQESEEVPRVLLSSAVYPALRRLQLAGPAEVFAALEPKAFPALDLLDFGPDDDRFIGTGQMEHWRQTL